MICAEAGDKSWGLPTLLDHFTVPGPVGQHLCFVMHICGGSISKFRRMAPNKALPLHIVKTIILQLLDCLKQLHKWGIIHAGKHVEPRLRTTSMPLPFADTISPCAGIKPENILVFSYEDKEVRFRLSDFSCARIADYIATKSGNKDSYKTGRNPGTPTYRAPESDGQTSRPYDMWSLGCVYLEVLVWFIEGYEKLKSFRKSREGPVQPGGLWDESFYHTIYKVTEPRKPVTELRESVTEKINYLSQHSSDGLKDILDAIPSLLKIDPKRRLDASQLTSRLKHLDTSVSSVESKRGNFSSLAAPTVKPLKLPIQNNHPKFGDRVIVTESDKRPFSTTLL